MSERAVPEWVRKMSVDAEHATLGDWRSPDAYIAFREGFVECWNRLLSEAPVVEAVKREGEVRSYFRPVGEEPLIVKIGKHYRLVAVEETDE